MARWERLLEQMRTSERGTGFGYDDCAAVLRGLGFTQVKTGAGGSHRRWARLLPSGRRVIIGLVERGSGEIKAVYVKEMLNALGAAELLPEKDANDS